MSTDPLDNRKPQRDNQTIKPDRVERIVVALRRRRTLFDQLDDRAKIIIDMAGQKVDIQVTGFFSDPA